MMPYRVHPVNNAPNALIRSNIEATLKRGYLEMKPETCSGVISIVGAGPSLRYTYKDLVGDVMACNSAHDFMIEHGVVPKYAMLWDANEVMAQMVKPHPGVLYLLASRCHPAVFERLRGYNVEVWHAIGDEELPAIMAEHDRDEIAIAGGSSSVLRSAYVAATLGYRKEMHLFGIDSCYSGADTHVNGSLVKQQRMRILAGGRKFIVAPWMAAQGEDFKFFAPKLREQGYKIVVHGDGLIPFLAAQMGFETPDMKIPWLESRLKHWHALQAIYLILRRSPQLLGGS